MTLTNVNFISTYAQQKPLVHFPTSYAQITYIITTLRIYLHIYNARYKSTILKITHPTHTIYTSSYQTHKGESPNNIQKRSSSSKKGYKKGVFMSGSRRSAPVRRVTGGAAGDGRGTIGPVKLCMGGVAAHLS